MRQSFFLKNETSQTCNFFLNEQIKNTYELGPCFDLEVVITRKIRVQKHKQFVLQINNEDKPMLVQDNRKAKLQQEK